MTHNLLSSIQPIKSVGEDIFHPLNVHFPSTISFRNPSDMIVASPDEGGKVKEGCVSFALN